MENLFRSGWQTLSGFLSVGYVLLFAFFLNTPLGNEFRERAIAPLEFNLRQKLQPQEHFSDQLKVIVYGDKARNEFGVQELLPLHSWTEFISAVAARRPKAILFDKMFTFALGSDSEIHQFNSTLLNLNVPVVAAGTFSIASQNDGAFAESQFSKWDLDDPSRLEEGQLGTFIGPHKEIRLAFKKLGGIRQQFSATIQPAWMDRQFSALLPHLSLSFAQQVKLSGETLDVDGVEFYLDRFNRIPVNFIPRQAAYEHFLPAASIFRDGSASFVLQKVNAGDVVLVLPSMYTGSTDFKNSPLGRIEGGLFHVSMLNALLTNTPLRPVLQSLPAFLTVALLISLLVRWASLKLKMERAVLLIAASFLAAVCIGLAGFVYGNFQSDWHAFAILILLNGATELGARAIKREKETEKIESVLEGLVPRQVLREIKSKPDLIYLRPKEQIVSVMFIDIEGFSIRTKDLLPVDTFSLLHMQIDEISNIVHAHGGVIDRILGDGMLCFFGFTFSNGQSQLEEDHAERALRCALAVQRRAALMTAQAQNTGVQSNSILPLRIGISTGEAFLGNMGSGRRIDFTIIGNTVNMAKRYEDACETFRVFISERTYRTMATRNAISELKGIAFYPRFMAAKHHPELVAGWECDPFADNVNLYKEALLGAYEEQHEQISAKLIRPNEPLKIRVNDTAEGVLSGLHQEHVFITTDHYFCRKVMLSLQLLTDSADLDAQLTVANLKTLSAQVVSGFPESHNKYQHRILLQHLTAEKRKVLERLLFNVP
jgi:class 3 adenylate cyclase